MRSIFSKIIGTRIVYLMAMAKKKAPPKTIPRAKLQSAVKW